MIYNINTTLQIDAHIGNVNDIAFVDRNKHICVITCGDDKTIKVNLVNVFSVYYHRWGMSTSLILLSSMSMSSLL